jgi:hypothetical protein
MRQMLPLTTPSDDPEKQRQDEGHVFYLYYRKMFEYTSNCPVGIILRCRPAFL